MVLRQSAAGAGDHDLGLSPLEVQDFRDQAESLDGVVEYHSMAFTLLGAGEPMRVQTGVVSWNFFQVLGVEPVLGRGFRAEEERPGAEAVLVAEPRVLAGAPGRRPGGGGPPLQHERPRPHRDRGPASPAPLSGRGRRVHAHRGLPVPLAAAGGGEPGITDAPGLRAGQGRRASRARGHRGGHHRGSDASRPPRGLRAGDRLRGQPAPVARGAGALRPPDLPRPPGHRRLRPAHRLRQRGQPHGGPPRGPGEGAGGAGRAGGRSRATAAPAPHREHAALDGWRCPGPGLGGGSQHAALRVRRPLHSPCVGASARWIGLRLHLRDGASDRHPRGLPSGPAFLAAADRGPGGRRTRRAGAARAPACAGRWWWRSSPSPSCC